jgi:site-specific recombinase XerD
MGFFQLPIFKRKTFPAASEQQLLQPVTPTGESRILQTLPAYLAHLQSSTYSKTTAAKYFSDVKKFALFLRDKNVRKITAHDIEQWTAGLLSSKGENLDRKTVNRKLSAVINYFIWLQGTGAITKDPALSLNNARVVSPLPDYLFESEIKSLYAEASKNPRTYIIVLLFLETGMKNSELFALTKAHVDVSDPYNPELWIKHTGKNIKKDRKVALPGRFIQAYQDYLANYVVEEVLFPITDRFVQMVFTELKKQTGIDKELTPKTLRHTHVVRALKRGEDIQTIFNRLGYAPASRQEAEEMYRRLAGRGI